ncbi:MAG TPA: CsgG/HfaB family protein [Gemmatimonadaceae bacterium]|nr:CsgG/HfaB family protein [Gemmatimonadaceae bacterium]
MRRPLASAAPLALLALLALLAACSTVVETTPTPVAAAEASARRALAAERTLGPPSADGHVVGVAPLGTADSALAPLGYALADLILTDLSRSRQLQVVDRTALHAMLRELDLAASGRVDSTTAPRTGRLLRANQLVVGGIAGSGGDALRLDGRVADVATGRVELAASADAPLVEVLDAEKALVLQLFDRLGVTLTPAERAAVMQRPTRSLAALLAYGRAVRYEVQGRYAPAAAEYARAARLDPDFLLARTRLFDVRAHADVWPLPVVPVSGEQAGYSAGTTSLGAAVVDQINRTYPIVPSGADSRSPADPVFPVTQATILITVILP